MTKVAEGKVEIKWNCTLNEVTGDGGGVRGIKISSAPDD